MDFKNMNFTDMEKSVYGGDLENDAELMAELAAIQEEEEMGMRRERQRQTVAETRRQQAPGNVPGIDQRALAAALADGHEDGNDEELEMDEELLNELAGITGTGESSEESTSSVPPPKVSQSSPPPVPSRALPTANVNRDEAQLSHLRQLHSVYSKMSDTAKKSGESAKERRYKRAVEKLVELIKSAEKGKKIDPSEIPVAPPNFTPDPHPSASVAQPSHHPTGSSIREAAAPAPPPVPQRTPSSSSTPATPPPIPQRKSSTIDPKKEEFLQILTHRRDLFVANGKAAIGAHDKEAAKEFVTMAKTFDQAIAGLKQQETTDGLDLSEVPPSPPPYRKKPEEEFSKPKPAPAPVPTTAPTQQPGTFLEALQHRQQRYLQIAEKAKADGNDRKTRMNQRIAGQYAEAIRDAKAGRPVAAAELPKLPDMTELPPQGGSAPRPAAQKGPAPGMKPPPQVGPLAPSGNPEKSRNSVQLEFLIQRQNEFKQAAILAKSKGDIELAKKYLLDAKGFDKMIEAARAGLPVSIKQTPIPPQSMTSGVTLQPKIQAGKSSDGGLENKGEKLEFLEKTLIEQVTLAQSNQMRFTRLGDVGKVKMFETWAKVSKQDLLLVRAVAQQNLNIPKFHYETRQIPSADLFPDLAEDAFELIITSCRNVPLPSGYEPHHANIFVKYTFPFPTETPQTGKTKNVSGSVNPEYGETIILSIGSGKLRNSKLQRAFKRGGLKFEVYQKGGFMRSDKLMGTCEWKLDKLETSAEMEDSLPLRDGRKAVGGLLSAKVRIREPIGDAKTQTQTHKWLILDN